MSATITLYTHPWSRGRMARWMLEECGTDYEVEVLQFGTSMKAAGGGGCRNSPHRSRI
ncbi:MAG: hypothetical protein FWD69_09415 [Polyangiaceae bacterium]|nr:hypothetical protein [Polyangiaceae bacterium]